jgi:hypothetical protein
MTTMTHAGSPQETTTTLPRDFGLPGWITVTWTAGGAFLVGGFLVAAMTLAGKMSGSSLLLTASGLFLVGGFLGLVHGALLGFFGRPEGTTGRQAVGGILLGAMYALPALTIGLVVSGWIAMTVVSLYTGNLVALGLTGAAWLAGAVIVMFAGAHGVEGLRNAYARWPERKMGTALVASSFAALLVTFLADRPVLWGIEMRVTEVGAVLLAALATIWLAGPVVTVALRAVQRIPRLREAMLAGNSGRFLTSVGLGLLVGVVLGMIALPFFNAPLRVAVPVATTGVVGVVAASLSRALVDEVLLRLFLVSGTAWLILRWRNVKPVEAATAAVMVGALVQLVLYLPWILGIGFPSVVTAAAFITLVVLLPALAFGALYWTRGFGAALLANATAVILIALMAG